MERLKKRCFTLGSFTGYCLLNSKGWEMKKLLIAGIRFYQKYLSPHIEDPVHDLAQYPCHLPYDGGGILCQ